MNWTSSKRSVAENGAIKRTTEQSSAHNSCILHLFLSAKINKIRNREGGGRRRFAAFFYFRLLGSFLLPFFSSSLFSVMLSPLSPFSQLPVERRSKKRKQKIEIEAKRTSPLETFQAQRRNWRCSCPAASIDVGGISEREATAATFFSKAVAVTVTTSHWRKRGLEKE